MPLSEHEQRILAEIERRLLEEDPKFAHQVGSSFRAHLGRRLKLAVAGFVVGLIIVISSTFFESVAVGVAGFVLMLAACSCSCGPCAAGPRSSARSADRPPRPGRPRPAASAARAAAAPRAASTPGGAR